MDIIMSSPSIVFCFCGQGGQHETMGVDMYHSCLSFRHLLDRLDHHYASVTGISLLDQSGIRQKKIDLSLVSQSAVSMVFSSFIQLGLVYTLRKIGIVPRYQIGHSNGEFVSFFSTLDLDREDNLYRIVQILYARSSLLSMVPEGQMMVAKMSVEQMVPKLGSECISAINSPQSITVSGLSETIPLLTSRCKEEGYKAMVLSMISKPFHSSWMYEYSTIFLEQNREIFKEMRPDYYPILCSSVDGKAHSYKDILPEYWKQNIDQPVLFQKGCECLREFDSRALVIEISPMSVLRTFIKTNLPDSTYICVQDEYDDHLDLSFIQCMIELSKYISIDFTMVERDFVSDHCKRLFSLFRQMQTRK